MISPRYKARLFSSAIPLAFSLCFPISDAMAMYTKHTPNAANGDEGRDAAPVPLRRGPIPCEGHKTSVVRATSTTTTAEVNKGDAPSGTGVIIVESNRTDNTSTARRKSVAANKPLSPQEHRAKETWLQRRAELFSALSQHRGNNLGTKDTFTDLLRLIRRHAKARFADGATCDLPISAIFDHARRERRGLTSEEWMHVHYFHARGQELPGYDRKVDKSYTEILSKKDGNARPGAREFESSTAWEKERKTLFSQLPKKSKFKGGYDKGLIPGLQKLAASMFADGIACARPIEVIMGCAKARGSIVTPEECDLLAYFWSRARAIDPNYEESWEDLSAEISAYNLECVQGGFKQKEQYWEDAAALFARLPKEERYKEGYERSLMQDFQKLAKTGVAEIEVCMGPLNVIRDCAQAQGRRITAKEWGLIHFFCQRAQEIEPGCETAL